MKNRFISFLLIGIMLTVTAIFLTVLYIDSRDKGTTDAVRPDTIKTEVLTPDTIVGYVGSGTSMHNLELIPMEGDTMELELSDDVDRRAELEIGRMIAVAVIWDDNNEVNVIATMDTSEVCQRK